MDRLVIDYLDKNFRMNFYDYLGGTVLDIHYKKQLLAPDLTNHIETVFSLHQNDARTIVNEWWDEKEVSHINDERNGIYNIKLY
jgi:hypothetical protein